MALQRGVGLGFLNGGCGALRKKCQAGVRADDHYVEQGLFFAFRLAVNRGTDGPKQKLDKFRYGQLEDDGIEFAFASSEASVTEG